MCHSLVAACLSRGYGSQKDLGRGEERVVKGEEGGTNG